MTTSIETYKKDFNKLLDQGNDLLNAMYYACDPDDFKKQLEELFKGEKAKNSIEEFIKALPSFNSTYQSWYSEAHALIGQLLPNRIDDFVRLYQKPKSRKEITNGNYVIEDYLQGLSRSNGFGEKLVEPSAAISQFQQQVAILKSVRRSFESSLMDIRQLVQADLFDSEIDVARELLKNKFLRAAGAVSGVILERHLAQVCDSHMLKILKKNPGISELNDAIKEGGIILTPEWRSIQHLGDLRNLCDHDKKVEPTVDQVRDLIAGTEKLVKNLA